MLHCTGVLMFKNMRIFILFDMLLNPNKDALSICKRLYSTISNRNKELQYLSKELSLSENFLNKIYNIA